jgi:hypothetical protein
MSDISINETIKLSDEISNDEIGSDSHSESSAYELYKLLEDRHDLYNNEFDDDSSDYEEKISSGEDQIS